MKDILQNHTAGAQSIGFDYQIYYFMYLALKLNPGEKVGFEVKDDVHIDMPDGSTILFQAKHSIQTNNSDDIVNLTNLDIDLWKTLSNWSEFIKSDKVFIDKHSFVLVTNKNENKNKFIDSLLKFKESKNIDDINQLLNELKEKTTDKTLKKNISKVINLGKKQKRQFFEKLTIETGVDNIIKRIKDLILKNIRVDKFVDIIFDCLYSNLQSSKYLEIKNGEKYIITFEDFNKKFSKCYEHLAINSPLPKREIDVDLPEDLEDQIFIKQLIDIGETKKGSNDITKYTTQMLQYINDFTYWVENDLLLPLDITDFKENSITIWANKFKSKYRIIQNKIENGTDIKNIEDEIKELGIELVEFIREKDLVLKNNNLGVPHSNGHFYDLSNNLEIGWHFDWENKYKKDK